MEQQDHCHYHPERPSVVNCQKMGYGLCQHCLEHDPQCAQPRQHCKFREQCVIFFRYKEARRQRARAGDMS